MPERRGRVVYLRRSPHSQTETAAETEGECMEKNKFKLMGTGVAIVIAAIFFVIALSVFPYRTTDMFGPLSDTKDRLTFAQVVVSFFGFIGAISAFTFAIFQYRKAEKWKRMQFVADEVRDLEADPIIQNALLMVDWGVRKINLFLIPDPEPNDYVKITRDVQWRALLPHPLKQKYGEYQAKTKMDIEGTSGEIRPGRDLGFHVTEARIRDTYDALLTRLDRLETFIAADLIRSDELRPFILYWIDALTSMDGPVDDATWRCTLLTYIDYYKYTGVHSLFERYGKKIAMDGDIYHSILAKVPDRDLAGRLSTCDR